MIEWRKILVATDFSPSARVALRSAEALTSQVGGTLELVHVLPRLPEPYKLIIGSFGSPELEKTRLQQAETQLERELSTVRARGLAIEGFVRTGQPWKEILEAAREVQADLVTLGNSGHSRLERLLLGSTAENVVRRSPVPVLVSRRRPLRKIARVLVPVDLGEGSRNALRFAVERLPESVELDALFVVPPPVSIDPYVLNLTADVPALELKLRVFLDEAGASRARAEVVLFREPAAEILDQAERRRAQLILLSTHGRRGPAHLLQGSVSEKVVRYADRPVLVLPGPGSRPPG